MRKMLFITLPVYQYVSVMVSVARTRRLCHARLACRRRLSDALIRWYFASVLLVAMRKNAVAIMAIRMRMCDVQSVHPNTMSRKWFEHPGSMNSPLFLPRTKVPG